MVIRSTILGFFLSLGLAVPAFANECSPVGKWRTFDDKTGEAKSIVTISEQSGKLYGQVTEILIVADKNAVCAKCEGDLKDKPVLGLTILSGLEPDGNRWDGGTILEPSTGKTYKASISVIDCGDRLEVRGYRGSRAFGRTQTWVREGDS